MGLHRRLALLQAVSLVTVHAMKHYDHTPEPIQEEDFNIGANGCKLDHGARTNKKLAVQPYYQRGRNGKMRNW